MKKMIVVIAVATAGLWGAAACATPTTATPQGASHQKTQTAFKTRPKAGTMARCPVMKHSFTVKGSTAWSKYKGRYYVFCCPGCKPKFDQDPKKYTGR